VGEKVLFRIARPYIFGGLIAIAGVAVLLLFGVPPYPACGIGFAAYAVFVLVVRSLQRNWFAEYLTATHDEIEETLRYSVANHPLPLCLVNSEGVLAMANEKFKAIFPGAKILKTDIGAVIGAENLDLLRREEDVDIGLRAADRDYQVLASYVNKDVSNSAMFYFLDVTEIGELKQINADEKLCYCYLIVDNYEDILQASPDETRSLRAAAIESLIRQLAGEVDGSLLKYRSSAYQILFSRKQYQKLESGKFAILDGARHLETDADFPTSFSIGVGLGGTPVLSEKYASYALDLARGRGGDQAVVKSGDSVEYFGGRVQVIENRNKGKSRVMSHAIRQLVSESSNVLIMGHKYADMDSFGASIALYRMVTTHGKNAAIVLNGFNHSLAEVHKIAVESGNYRFVGSEETLKLINDGTLLIVIDTHVPDMTDDSTLIGKTGKMIVIDHHRKRESVIEGATLMYMEPNASSTSELVTEILQYDDDIRKIGKFEAEMLLGGIFIDTNNFSVKTGARTFEAAAWLRMNGAETTNVRQFLQSDMEDFQQRASITGNAEFTEGGIAISAGEGKHDNAQIIIAQAADELLDIKGIRASFVVGATTKEIVISARSLGDINVQLIMERFGGGGHLTMAAAQVMDTTVDEVLANLKKYIREAEGENK
jgi:c-di-AMP phosphodiesterase-like protein